MRPVFNIAKLDDFSKSPYCPEDLRTKEPKEIYVALEEGTEARYAYDAFAQLRWMNAMVRRSEEAKKSGGLARSVTERLKMQKEYEALQSLRKDLAENVVPRGNEGAAPTKDYARLFAKTVDESEWTPVELELRKMFMSEMNIAAATGGCTGCSRNNLIRKYIEKAIALASGK